MSVTMPFKTEIIPLLDILDGGAREVGAVNTVKRDAKRYSGFNTDIDGILKPLHALAKQAKLTRGAVIGAGGAARAFVGAMHRLGCREVAVIARNPPRARRVLSELGERFPGMTLSVFGIERREIEKLGEIDILFNAAPIGGNGAEIPKEVFALLKGGPVVFDAVYDRVETELVAEARRQQCPTVPGHEMLLSQGLAAFEIWTGMKGPEDIMREALLDALRGGAR
jgi:shikimate dehydrogenase